jgi:hypothetical protein
MARDLNPDFPLVLNFQRTKEFALPRFRSNIPRLEGDM